MSPPPRLAVIVLNYNSQQDTIACVESIRASTCSGLSLLVIDNASPNGDGKSLERWLPPDEFMQLPRNIGYAGGNNAGIALALQAGVEFVLILNPDIRLTPEAITSYLDVMLRQPDLGILSPLQLVATAGPLDPKFEQSVIQRHGYRTAEILAADPDTLLDVTMVLGAVMLVRAAVFRNAGGFDPLYFAYGEEEDFCRRALARCWRIAVTVRAPAVHLRSKESTAVTQRVLFLRTKGVYLLRLKNNAHGFVTLAIRVLGQALADYVKLPVERYPFRSYPVSRRHVLLVILWLLAHLPQIFLHRRRERTQAPYLDFGTEPL